MKQLLFVLALACFNADGAVAGTDPGAVPPGAVENLELPAMSNAGPILDLYQTSGDLIVFRVRERDHGEVDLNGDGDDSDTLLFVHHVSSRETFNLGYSAGVIAVDGDFVAFLALELSEDLNGDGDLGDFVLHVYDGRERRVHNFALACFGDYTPPSLTLKDGLLAFYVDEEAQGHTDFDGDGTAIDVVPHAVRLDTARWKVRRIGLAANRISPSKMTNSGRLVAYLASEMYADVFLNQDGDKLDEILQVFDSETGETVNLGYNVLFLEADGPNLALGVLEQEANQDLNGSGHFSGYTLHVYEADRGVLRNLGLDLGYPFVFQDGIIAFPVSENAQRQDLNADGDQGDTILHVHDVRTGGTTNLGLPEPPGPGLGIQLGDDVVVFPVRENQGTGDLNGDRDTIDIVLHVHDRTTGITRNLQLAVGGRIPGSGAYEYGLGQLTGSTLAFYVYEHAQHEADLNGDGDSEDMVLHVYDPDTGAVQNLRLAADRSTMDLSVGDGFVGFFVNERAQGLDLNGNGLIGGIEANAPFFYDLERRRAFMSPVVGKLLATGEKQLVYLLEERYMWSDYNGDGDFKDLVLQILRPTSTAGLETF